MNVSVTIPAFNAQQTLGACLEGLTRQDCPQDTYEIIVVDDGSTDRTAEIARHYGVRLLCQENQGPAAARNAGASVSNGDIILFTDADCIPQDDWITQMLAPFQKDDVAAVKGAYRTEQRAIVARFAQIEFEERYRILERAGHTDMVDTYSAGYRRHLFNDLGGFDTRFPVANNEDTELSYRMAAAGLKMVFNPGAVVYHLGHPDTLNRYAVLKFGRGYWRMIVYRQFPGKMLRDTYTPRTLKTQIVSLLCFLCALPLAFLVRDVGLILLCASVLFFVCSILSFCLQAIKKDVLVGLCCPFFLAVRAASLGFGALWGLVKGRLQHGVAFADS